MYLQGTPEFEHHLKTYGPHTEFGYFDLPLKGMCCMLFTWIGRVMKLSSNR